MSYLKTTPSGLCVANHPSPFCTSATTFVRSAAENFKFAFGPSTMTIPTATEPVSR